MVGIRALALGVLLLLLLPTVGDAQGSPPPGRPAEEPAAEMIWLVGVHAVAPKEGSAAATEGMGFAAALGEPFQLRHLLVGVNAQEEDFRSVAQGGREERYLDAVDLQLFVGLGAPGRLHFAPGSRDDEVLEMPAECAGAWGDGDNRWLALMAGRVLADVPPNDGYPDSLVNCMQGQHLLLGYASPLDAYADPSHSQGSVFGSLLSQGFGVASAWFQSCDLLQPGRVSRVLGTSTACFDDNPRRESLCSPGSGAGAVLYTHACGTRLPQAPATVGLPGLPRLAFVPDPLEVQQPDPLLALFHMQDAVPVTGSYPPSAYVLGDRFLLRPGSPGSFIYADLNRLWSGASLVGGLSWDPQATGAIDAAEARQVADWFLTTRQLMPEDAYFSAVLSDTVRLLHSPSEAGVAGVQAPQAAVVWQVVYSRSLTVTVPGADGGQPAVSVPVVGPGAQLRVYVPTQMPESAAFLTETLPVGVQGGWRKILGSVGVDRAVASPQSVVDAATAITLYQALGSQVALNGTFSAPASQEVLSTTLAYWEAGPFAGQAFPVPVHVLQVRQVEPDGGILPDEWVYVPMDTIFMAPVAQILDAPAAVLAGSEVTLTAADAAQSLRQLGLADLDLVLGYAGAAGLYVYNWYLGSVAPENRLQDKDPADGPHRITFDIPIPPATGRGYLDLYLVVTDIDSPQAARSRALTQIRVPVLYLPAFGH